jgi:hypothetical protein
MFVAISRPFRSASSSPAAVIGVSQGRGAASTFYQAIEDEGIGMNLRTFSPSSIGIICSRAVPNQYQTHNFNAKTGAVAVQNDSRMSTLQRRMYPNAHAIICIARRQQHAASASERGDDARDAAEKSAHFFQLFFYGKLNSF